MHLVKSTTGQICRSIVLLSCALAMAANLMAQENAPYSRYGLGDVVPGQHIVNRGMGGISAAYSDYGIIGAPFNINMINPASLGNLTNTKNFSNTIFDIGAEVDVRTLKSTSSPEKYKATNTVISYLQIAFPVSSQKMEKKGTSWGLSFGLRPLTRINYKIEQNNRISSIDSTNTLYEGTGGLNQFNISTGIRKVGKGSHKNEFSIGFSTGYTFGNKNYSTRLSFVNDSVYYYKSNFDVTTRMNGLFLNTGIQYVMHLTNAGTLRLGAYANLQQRLTAYKSTLYETYANDGNGGYNSIDSIYKINDQKGKVIVPSTIGGGFTYQSNNKQWLVGADYEMTQWSDYRFYNQTDQVHNNWTIRAGAEYYPIRSTSSSNVYWNYVKYRAGMYYGPDYIRINGMVRNNYAATLGASFPLTTPRSIQSRGEYVTLNTSCEIGTRGSNQSLGLKENFVRLNIGISMNARWFQKRSYD